MKNLVWIVISAFIAIGGYQLYSGKSTDALIGVKIEKSDCF